MSENAIELRDVVKAYRPTPEVEVLALKGVTLEVRRGDYISIMGPSGSGKTTLLNIIGTMDKPTSGRILIDDVDVTDVGEEKLADFRCNKLGYLFQFFNLISTLNAVENVTLPMVLSGKYTEEEAEERAVELLNLVALDERTFRNRPVQMSGGERQRVGLARALANEPALILMDEPTGALDTVTGGKVMRLTQMLNDLFGQTFIVVSHNPSVARVADRMYYIRDGQLFDNPPESLLKLNVRLTSNEKTDLYSAQLRLLKQSITMLDRRWERGDIEEGTYVRIKGDIAQQLERMRRAILSHRR